MSNNIDDTLKYDTDVLFEYFVLFIVPIEALYFTKREIHVKIDNKDVSIEINKDIKNSKHPIMSSMRWMLTARYHPSNTAKKLTESISEKVQLELYKCNFNTQQQKFIWQWVKGEISLK